MVTVTQQSYKQFRAGVDTARSKQRELRVAAVGPKVYEHEPLVQHLTVFLGVVTAGADGRAGDLVDSEHIIFAAARLSGERRPPANEAAHIAEASRVNLNIDKTKLY